MMEKWKVPEEARPFVDSLRELISPGIHAASTLESSPLVDMEFVTGKTGSEAPAAARAAVFIDELERITGEELKGNDPERAACLFALGDYSGVPARKRYERMAHLHDKFASWESYRKEPLDRFLFSIYLRLYREGRKVMPMNPSQGADDTESSLRPRKRVVGGDYIINRYESIYNLPPEPGSPREFLQFRKITATTDGVDAWRASTRWWNKGVGELPTLTLFGSGKLSITYDAQITRDNKVGRAYITEVKFAEPLQHGARTEFAILKTHQVEWEEVVQEGWRDWCGLLDIKNPIESAVQSVRFPREVTPRTVWYFEDLPEWLVPGAASDENTLSVDSTGFVTYAWTDLLIGHSYGLAWIW